MSAGHVKRLPDVGKYMHYEVNCYGEIAELWVLPVFAEKAWIDSMEELETFSRKMN